MTQQDAGSRAAERARCENEVEGTHLHRLRAEDARGAEPSGRAQDENHGRHRRVIERRADRHDEEQEGKREPDVDRTHQEHVDIDPGAALQGLDSRELTDDANAQAGRDREHRPATVAQQGEHTGGERADADRPGDLRPLAPFEPPGNDPDRRADRRREKGRERADGERESGPDGQPRELVPVDAIGAEPEVPRGADGGVQRRHPAREVAGERVVRRDERSDGRKDGEGDDDREAGFRGPIATPARPHGALLRRKPSTTSANASGTSSAGE